MQLVRVRLIENENGGCELAPVEIMKELRNIRNIDVDKLNLEEIHVDLNNFDEANHLIFENSKELFEMNDRCFFIGGDNSINYSLIKGFDKVVNGLLVVFDAHTNCDENGWIRRLIEGGFNGRRVILIGCRNIGDNELKFIKEEEINLIRMDVLNEDLEGVCDMVMGRVKDSKGFYVNFSLNCIDPGFAPGVCCLESGGISANDSLYFVKRLKLLQNFRGLGVVNLNPSKDFNRMSINLGARLLGSSIL
ncbi:MAG TPA: arginase family protein [Candidatus Pacearchaeota archaeon]|jgi:agmatinase|nr:arginase family protein [Candidatus Pacearchaeota archaeon]|tara:strand:- start:49 stop:795 length:747 start_codon:yes stop_codon:yes gene_type:complete